MGGRSRLLHRLPCTILERVGQMLREQKETVGFAKGGQPYQATGSVLEPVELPTLADVGIDKKLSMRSQQLAAVPEGKTGRFE